jgi:hypothetical protein
MKMRKEHYDFMYNQMADKYAATPAADLEAYKQAIKNDARVTDANVRIAFDLAYAANLNSFICDVLYPYLNDTHIKTAVLDICRKIGFTIN